MTREQKIEEAARALLKACEGDSPDSATAWRSLYGAMKNMRAALSAPPTSETVYTTAECPSCGTEVDGIRVLVERDGVLVNPPSAPPSPAEGEREACAKRVEALRDRWKAIYGNGLRPGVVEALDAAANTVRAGEMTTPVDTWDTSPRPPSTSAPPQTDEGACPVCRHPEHGVTLCPVCHDCREECVTVDAASPQTDEGAAMMRTIYGRDLAGVWHATTATYKGAIDTVCGQRGLAAALFSTDPRQHDSIRPEFCDACEGRASRASGRGAVSERDAAAWGRLTAEGDRKIAAAVEAEKDAEIARLRAALAEAERERDEAIEDERAAAAQRLTEARRADAAEASLAQAREVLRAVEWAAFDEMEERYCAACLNYKRVGHAPDCALASALGRGDGGGTT